MRYYSSLNLIDEVKKMGQNIDENQMTLLLGRCKVPNEESKAISFRGFDSKPITLKIVADTVRAHDHLELWMEGKYIGYLHLDQKVIYFWSKEGEGASIALADAK